MGKNYICRLPFLPFFYPRILFSFTYPRQKTSFQVWKFTQTRSHVSDVHVKVGQIKTNLISAATCHHLPADARDKESWETCAEVHPQKELSSSAFHLIKIPQSTVNTHNSMRNRDSHQKNKISSPHSAESWELWETQPAISIKMPTIFHSKADRTSLPCTSTSRVVSPSRFDLPGVFICQLDVTTCAGDICTGPGKTDRRDLTVVWHIGQLWLELGGRGSHNSLVSTIFFLPATDKNCFSC